MASGCASMDTYVPKTVGPVPQDMPHELLRMQIDADEDFVPRGDIVTFSVTLKNHSPDALWIPDDPNLLLVWTYPNGRRDNFLQDAPGPAFYDESSAIRLAPGEEMIRRVHIQTHSFNFDGVTEFRAILEVAGNINPKLQPFWTGRVVSNGYGVMVARRSRLAELELPSVRRESGDPS